jgi:hypothetical protein
MRSQELGLDRWIRDKRVEPPPRLPALEERWFRIAEEMVALLQPLKDPPPA